MQPGVTNWVQKILKTMFEFVFQQETQNERQSYDNSLRIMTVKSTITIWSDKFQDIVSKNTETV